MISAGCTLMVPAVMSGVDASFMAWTLAQVVVLFKGLGTVWVPLKFWRRASNGASPVLIPFRGFQQGFVVVLYKRPRNGVPEARRSGVSPWRFLCVGFFWFS